MTVHTTRSTKFDQAVNQAAKRYAWACLQQGLTPDVGRHLLPFTGRLADTVIAQAQAMLANQKTRAAISTSTDLQGFRL